MARFLIVGAGGIGGVVAAHLIEQGQDVTALTTNPLIADAVGAFGYRVRGDASPGTVRGPIVQTLRPADKFDFILLATQPPQVEEAARTVQGALADDGRFVCFQNGLCEERVGAIVGQERVVGAVVAWGASMVEPGVYDRTSSGGFQLGRWDGSADPRLDELATALEAIHRRFAPAYGPAAGNQGWYAMDVEFKFDAPYPGAEPTLVIKQARPHPGRGQ